MSAWVPAMTAGSLDGFVVGALVTGACFLVITASWRAWRRESAEDDSPSLFEVFEVAGVPEDPVAAGPDAPTLDQPRTDGPASETRESETRDSETRDSKMPDSEMRDRERYDPVTRNLAIGQGSGSGRHDAATRDYLAAVTAARRWQEAATARRDEQVTEQVPAGRPAEQAGDLPARPPRPREPSALDGYGPAPTGAPPDKPAQGGRHGRPGGGHRAPDPLGDPMLGDPTFGSTAGMPLPPGARRPPRHAAPTPSLGEKVTGKLARSVADSGRD